AEVECVAPLCTLRRRIAARSDVGEKPFRFGSRRLRGPWGAVLANRKLAQRRTTAAPQTVVQDVALAAARSGTDTESLYFRVPQHYFAIGAGNQAVNRTFRDFALHAASIPD